MLHREEDAGHTALDVAHEELLLVSAKNIIILIK